MLEYIPGTGQFLWKEGAVWNRSPGEEAGYRKPDGYKTYKIFGQTYFGQQLAWFYMFGVWPSEEIDHINHDRADNRFLNLRPASDAQNARNRVARRGRRLPTGVERIRGCGRFRARIGHKHLGMFDKPEDAHLSYMVAAREDYGDFANSGFCREPAWIMNVALSFGC
jgi:hypothetical protein